MNYAQEVTLPEVVITATRTPVNPVDVPARVDIISRTQIEAVPANNVDDLLMTAGAIQVGRTNGIFSKNSSIVMRGLNGSYRSLILIDGVPINKSDGGSINWSRLNNASIERIEVVEGPGSALYGGNAMGGTINIITRIPSHLIEGNAALTLGSFGTLGESFYVGGKAKNNGFSWSLNSFARRGDGYITAPDTARDSTDTPIYLKEFNFGGRASYQWKNGGKLSLDLNYYDDKRGDGFKAFEGGFNKFTTQNIHLDYQGIILGFIAKIAVFYQAEDFLNQKESLKYDKVPPFAYLGYQLYESAALRIDKGIWMSFTRRLGPSHNFTFGSDMKIGSVNGSDTYLTSTDIINNQGRMDIGAVFVQDEMQFFQNKLKVIAGVRYDIAKFSDASFSIDYPTITSEFMTGLTGPYPSTNWSALSPKLSVQYGINPRSQLYFSYGRGFRPPILDDMCRNRSISKGFKLANPELTPEFMDNLELGGTFNITPKLSLKPSLYYSLGRDFNYFVNTGDSLMAGNKLKPILKRENVAGVNIYGFQLYLNMELPHGLYFNMNYAHNTGKITSFTRTVSTTADLDGKYLVEAAPNVFYGSLRWENKWVNLRIAFQFLDASWYDDENITKNPAYSTFDFKAWHQWKRGWGAAVGIQNLLNTEYLDNQGTLGLPRYITLVLSYKLQYQ
ncbi:MAG: TonB-dependent receptor [Bacteroidota bacterium]